MLKAFLVLRHSRKMDREVAPSQRGRVCGTALLHNWGLMKTISVPSEGSTPWPRPLPTSSGDKVPTHDTLGHTQTIPTPEHQDKAVTLSAVTNSKVPPHTQQQVTAHTGVDRPEKMVRPEKADALLSDW